VSDLPGFPDDDIVMFDLGDVQATLSVSVTLYLESRVNGMRDGLGSFTIESSDELLPWELDHGQVLFFTNYLRSSRGHVIPSARTGIH